MKVEYENQQLQEEIKNPSQNLIAQKHDQSCHLYLNDGKQPNNNGLYDQKQSERANGQTQNGAKQASCSCSQSIDTKKISLQAVNSWRSLGKPAKKHLDFYYQLYLNKLPRKKITMIPERMKTRYSVDGYEVWLPFEKPYNCQREYISRVIEALRTGNNAMLESPTGTGKTISFLCAAVAFMKKARERQETLAAQNGASNLPTKDTAPHTIIYCTRTHTQIKQVISEIKAKLPYKCTTQTLAAKQQLCIMEDIKSNSHSHMLNHKCSKLRQSRRLDETPGQYGDKNNTNSNWMDQVSMINQDKNSANFDFGIGNGARQLEPNSIKEMHSACQFYMGEEMSIAHYPTTSLNFRHKKFNPIIDMIDERLHETMTEQNGGETPQQSTDIEDLIKLGKQHNLCPYYLAKSRIAGADIVVLPYQYLLTTHIRRQLQLNLKNSIILFDEAHNIDGNCEDVLSFDIQVEHFWEAFRLLDAISKPKGTDNFDEYSRRKKATHLKCFLMRLYNAIKNIDLQEQKNALGQVQKCITGVFILELEEFLSRFDKLLMDSGDNYDVVYVSSENEDGGGDHLNSNNRPSNDDGAIETSIPITSRNFSKKQGHKVAENFLSDHDGLESPQNDQDSRQVTQIGVQILKGGQKYIRYNKREEDVKQEELTRLIDFAYTCFDNQSDNQKDQGNSNNNHDDNNGAQLQENTANADHENTGFRKYREDTTQADMAENNHNTVPPPAFAQPSERHTSMDRSKLSYIIEMLEKINKVKRLIKRGDKSQLQLQDFKFFIRTNKGAKGQEKKQHMTQWGIYCLNPSYIFKQIYKDPEEKPLSVILTSGTLQPMKILYQELKTHFKVKLVNQHFVDDSQVFAAVIKEDFRGNPFKFNFENQHMLKSFRQLGLLLSRLTKGIQGGILMFFTSYTHIAQCYKEFQDSRFDFGGASIFQESKDSRQSALQYERYKEAIGLHNKGIMMCVSRGKLSEGLNFSDNLARACLVIGIPYLLVNDSKVNLKKQYLDQSNEQIAVEPDYSGDPTSQNQYTRITGDYWYKMTAIREVNQIIGRCIRHQNDYASIFLIDQRYDRKMIKDKLSQWVKDKLRTFDKIETLEEDLKSFYQHNSLMQYQHQMREQQLSQETLKDKLKRDLLYNRKDVQKQLIQADLRSFQEMAIEQKVVANPIVDDIIKLGQNNHLNNQCKEQKSEPMQQNILNNIIMDAMPENQAASSSSSEDVVITTGMLGLDSSKEREEDQHDDEDNDLINGLSMSQNSNIVVADEEDKLVSESLNILPEDLSSLLFSQVAVQDDQMLPESSRLNISDKELLSAIFEQDSSLMNPEEIDPELLQSDDDMANSDFAQSEVAELMLSSKAAEGSIKLKNIGEDQSISIGEETLAALETKEQIYLNSQLSFDMHDLKELCTSQISVDGSAPQISSKHPQNFFTQKDHVIEKDNNNNSCLSHLSLSHLDPLEQLRRMKPKQNGAADETDSNPIATQNFMQFLLDWQQTGQKAQVRNGNNALIYGNEHLTTYGDDIKTNLAKPADQAGDNNNSTIDQQEQPVMLGQQREQQQNGHTKSSTKDLNINGTDESILAGFKRSYNQWTSQTKKEDHQHLGTKRANQNRC